MIGQLLRTLLSTNWSCYDFIWVDLRASFELIRSWHGLFVMSIQFYRFWIWSCFLLMRQHNNCLWFVLIVSISIWYETISLLFDMIMFTRLCGNKWNRVYLPILSFDLVCSICIQVSIWMRILAIKYLLIVWMYFLRFELIFNMILCLI